VLRSRRLRGKSASLGDEETVGGDAKRGVVVKAAPASTLIMAEANFSFEFLVVPLDPPASLGACYKLSNQGVGWQRCQPVFCRLGVAFRPFNHEPFFRPRRASFDVAVGGTHANRGDSSRQRCVGAVAAGYSLPSVLRQCVRQRLGRDRLVRAVRRSRIDGRPRPPGGLIGSGPSSGGQRLVEDWMPITYVILSSVIPSRNSVSTPYQASASMQPRGTGASRAARICASAICGLVWRFDPRCHRFHALAITQQDETGAIRVQWF
jgi:hypothetical protein